MTATATVQIDPLVEKLTAEGLIGLSAASRMYGSFRGDRPPRGGTGTAIRAR